MGLGIERENQLEKIEKKNKESQTERQEMGN